MSDDETGPAPARAPPQRRTTIFLALGLGAALIGVWFCRCHLAETLIRASLAASGLDADLRMTRLDFTGASVAGLRIGSVKTPDFWAKTASFDLDWSALRPRLRAIAASGAGLRLRLDGHRPSLGAWSRVNRKAENGATARFPDWAINISDFHVIGETPFGAFDAVVDAHGRTRTNLRARARITPADLAGTQGGAERFQAELDIVANGSQLTGALNASAGDLTWRERPDTPAAHISRPRLSAQFILPLDMSAALASVEFTADQAAWAGLFEAQTPRFTAQAHFARFAPDFTPGPLGGAFQGAIAHATITGQTIDGATLAGALGAGGELTLRAWRAKSAALAIDHARIALAPDKGGARVAGWAALSAPLAGVTVIDARAPLDLALSWDHGFRAAPTNGACVSIDAARIEAAGAAFVDAQARLCPGADGAFFTAGSDGALTGGFAIAHLAWAGPISGGKGARLAAAAIGASLSGDTQIPILTITAARARFGADYPQGRRLRIGADMITARFAGAKDWSLTGAFEGAAAQDTSLPGQLSEFAAPWRAAPDRRGNAIFQFDHGRAALSASAGAPLFHSLLARNIEGALRNGVVTARGALALAAKPAQRLGAFTLTHDANTGQGEAQATAGDLNFSPSLQPYDVSEFARGVVDDARGPIDADLHARWTRDGITTGARASLKSVSFATAALGPITGVVGAIEFNDLIAMTTPPGQDFHIASMDPGIVIEQGDFKFHIENGQRLAIESASWPFAKGVLAIKPTILQLGAEDMRLTLTLSDVDVAALTEALHIKDLTATGLVEGSFPLVLTPTKGRIEHGRIDSGPVGGLISYQGDIGVKSGPARIAFDALRSFHYDKLSLDLDGDLDGELVSAIHFTGQNREPLNPSASVFPIKIVGIPFKFTVTVQAPFMALAHNAAGVGDASQYLRDIRAQPGPNAPAP